MSEATGAEGYAGLGHGEFCWTEIAATDATKCMDFYTNVFGWKFQTSEVVTDGFAYHEYSTGGGYPAGGLYEITPDMFPQGAPPPHFMTYIAVDDVDEYARKATELGGMVLHGPDDIPNTGRFAMLQDPTGAMFSIFKMAEGSHHG